MDTHMNLSLDVIAGVIGAVLVIVWLVRLEGRVNAKADSERVAVVASEVVALQVQATAHAKMNDEVIRLQEQIKHLTDLIERWLKPPVRRNSGSGD
jgi:HAMP domain-containing protein